MRITTNAILRNYQSNLGNSMKNLDIDRTKVMTGRKFSLASEDPSSALKAVMVERRYQQNDDYLNMVQDVQSFQDAQEDAVYQLNTLASTLSKQYGIEALNGTNGSEEIRDTYAKAFRGAQESMVLALNAKYAGKFVLSGSQGDEPPFKLSADGKTLTYRGLNVNDPANAAALKELSDDTVYVDLGFGLTIDAANKVDSTSAFNTTLPGINVVGFGQDGDGDPKNMILLAGQIADELEKADGAFDHSRLVDLVGKFDQGRETVLANLTTLGTQTQFLTATKERLTNSELSLNKEYTNAVQVDMAEAIMNYSWSQYAYNAALKVGTSILSPSFIDFMR